MFYILLVSLVLLCDAQELHESNGIDLLPANNICGIQNNDRIVGGVLTDLDEHPWTALIKYDRPKGNAFSCGGVLISSRYVMTAAHCVKNLPQDWKLSQVRLGEWNLTSKIDCQLDDCSSDPLDVDIEEAIAHENYNSTKGQNNDIALLRLVRDVRFSDFVKPICLPIGPALKKKTFEGYDMVVAGWGKTETSRATLNEVPSNYAASQSSGQPNIVFLPHHFPGMYNAEANRLFYNRAGCEGHRSKSDIKLKVRVTVRNTQDCQNVYSRINLQITENQLCAGGLEGQDSCRGDSGGALMGQHDDSFSWIAVGIVSYGPSPCGTPGWPGVYTRVTSYVDWILSKIRP